MIFDEAVMSLVTLAAAKDAVATPSSHFDDCGATYNDGIAALHFLAS